MFGLSMTPTPSSPIRLSICIPTYNFGKYIAETLDSITSQIECGVEIVVLDGGSKDNTAEVVARYSRDFPEVSYIRNDVRGGIDRDMARSVELAKGDYCWLFSSDDIMASGAIKKVLTEIAGGLDLYLCGLTLCDKYMNPIVEHTISSATWGAVFNLKNLSDRERYFAAAQTTTAFFSFMGSIIVRRDRWLQQSLEEAYVGSCWAHVVRILRMIPDGLSVKFLGESLQLKRGDNDSFMDKGLVHRYALAIDGYHRIAADVFPQNSLEARHIRRVIVNEFPLKAMFYTRVNCRDSGRGADVPELNRLVRKTYSDFDLRNMVYLAGYYLIPMKFYEIIRMIYRGIRGRPLR